MFDKTTQVPKRCNVIILILRFYKGIPGYAYKINGLRAGPSSSKLVTTISCMFTVGCLVAYVMIRYKSTHRCKMQQIL